MRRDLIEAFTGILATIADLPAQVQAVIAEQREQRAILQQLVDTVPTSGLADVPTAAARLNLSEATIRRRIADGTLPTVRIGRAVRVDLSKIQAVTTDDVAEAAAEARAIKAVR